MYSHGEAEGVGEEDGSVHWVHRTVSDMEQRGRVVEAQVADGRDGEGWLKKNKRSVSLKCILIQL